MNPIDRIRPIIFNSEMVKAILDGRKTQTRRVIKPQPEIVDKEPRYEKYTWAFWSDEIRKYRNGLIVESKYGKPGDRLWVRETWAGIKGGAACIAGEIQEFEPSIVYKVDGFNYNKELKWKSSIFMPRWASRITLEITDVRVERLQKISEGDIKKEGFTLKGFEVQSLSHQRRYRMEWFMTLWNSLAKKGFKWNDDPWVWVISFRRII